MSALDLFDLNNPVDLYEIVLDTYDKYVQEPTEKDFFFLVFGFTHLREWISESGYAEIVKKKNAGTPLSNAEKFFEEIYDLPSFKVVQELCNRGKHHVTQGKFKTSKDQGIKVGLARAGDKVGQTHFLIDGRDSREYFIELVHKYNSWFGKNNR